MTDFRWQVSTPQRDQGPSTCVSNPALAKSSQIIKEKSSLMGRMVVKQLNPFRGDEKTDEVVHFWTRC